MVGNTTVNQRRSQRRDRGLQPPTPCCPLEPHKSLPNKFWHSEEEKEGEERNKGKREERRKKMSLPVPNSGSAPANCSNNIHQSFWDKWTTFPMHQSVDPWTVASQCAVRSRAQVAEQLHANSDSDTYTDDMPTWLIRNKQLPLSIHKI